MRASYGVSIVSTKSHWCPSFATVLFYNYFSPSGDQPEQRILAHKSEQPTASCMGIFHKYCCHIKHGGIIINLILWNPWEVYYWYIKMPQCRYMDGLVYIMFYVKKHKALLAICYNPLLVCDKLLWVPTFVRLAYCWAVCWYVAGIVVQFNSIMFICMIHLHICSHFRSLKAMMGLFDPTEVIMP